MALQWQLINGPMNREMFDLYVETQLAPSLEPGDVVILDNLAVHKSKKAKAILHERDAWFLFRCSGKRPRRGLFSSLQPYSLDLNPIEINRPLSRTHGVRGFIFSKIKAHLRRIGARTIDVLWHAIDEICDLYDSDECWSYFKAARYGFD